MERSQMNTIRGSTRRSRLIKMAAAVGAGLITVGLAAAKPVPAHDPTINQAAAVTTTAAADEPMLRKSDRDATPGGSAATGMPGGPEIRVDGLFGPKTTTTAQVVPR
jgi:hypothetical protein